MTGSPRNFQQEMVELGDRLDVCLRLMETENNLTMWYCRVYETELMLWNNRVNIARALQSMCA